jgi:hypothetical protein
MTKIKFFAIAALLLLSSSALADQPFKNALRPAGPIGAARSGTGSITGGTVNRTESDRWQDNWIVASELAGIDCSGATDSTAALQSALNHDEAQIVLPKSCHLKIGTGNTTGCAITINAHKGVQLRSFSKANNADPFAPSIFWAGSGGNAFCFVDNDHPTIDGIMFTTNSTNVVDTYLDFTGPNTGGSTPTLPTITNTSIFGSAANPNFKGISIGAGSGSNNENAYIFNNDVSCSYHKAILKTRTASIRNGSVALTVPGGTYVSGNVGLPITISVPAGALQTTIATVVSGTSITVADAWPYATATNATVHNDRSYGTGIYIGNNANAKHNKIYNNRTSQCHIGLDLTVSFDVNFIEGGFNDIGIQVRGLIEPSTINNYESEQDVQAVIVTNNNSTQLSLWNFRGSNANQRADGFMRLGNPGGSFNIQNYGGIDGDMQNLNVILFRFGSSSRVFTALNLYTAANKPTSGATFDQVNYSSAFMTHYNMDAFLNVSGEGNSGISGYAGTVDVGQASSHGIFTTCTNHPSGMIYSNAGVISLCP